MSIRHFGIDIHKNFVMVAAVNNKQETVQQPMRVEMSVLPQWIEQTLTPQDRCVIEVTNNAWYVHDLLEASAGEVIVANPYKTKLIASAKIKSDKVDAIALARLLAANFIYEVVVPDQDMRQHRQLASHYTSLTKQVRRIKAQIHALLDRHHHVCPANDVFSSAGLDWLNQLELPLIERTILDQLLGQLEVITQQRDETDRLIARLAEPDSQITRLMQISGINYFTAFALLAAIGDIRRFSSPDKLTAYMGLVPSLHQSGNYSHTGHITKAGNSQIRWLMVEAAWNAVRWEPHWRKVYDRIKQRRGSSIAIVAVARKLLVVVWHLLHNHSQYHHLKPATFVRKLQEWAWRIGRDYLPDDTSIEFVRRQLKTIQFHSLTTRLQTNKKGRLKLLPA